MLKSQFKNITFLIGVLTMFVGGLIFMVMSDITFHNNSGNLIVSVLLCFGSAIIFFFANNFNEKPAIMYLMKGIGLALAIGLVVYYHWFKGSEYYFNELETLRKAGLVKANQYAGAKASIVIAMVFAYVATAVLAANIVLTATLKDDVEKREEQGVELELAKAVVRRAEEEKQANEGAEAAAELVVEPVAEADAAQE